MDIAFVTGSSSGIGFETALRLAKSGFKVYAAMRNPDRSPELGNRALKEKLPIEVVKMDVTDLEEVQRTFATVFDKEGHLDILVNNAGIGGHGAIEEAPLSLFRQIMETNYFGTLHCIKQVLPSMRERKKGHILNVTSLAGTMASAFHGPYSASKFAVESLSECLAQELLPYRVRVSIIQPGVIETPIFKKGDTSTHVQTNYHRLHRFYLNFKNGLKLKNPPSVVAKRVLKVIRNPLAPFRNPSGLGAYGALEYRKKMTDEEWIQLGNLSDEAWCKTVEPDIAKEYMDLCNQLTNKSPYEAP